MDGEAAAGLAGAPEATAAGALVGEDAAAALAEAICFTLAWAR